MGFKRDWTWRQKFWDVILPLCLLIKLVKPCHLFWPLGPLLWSDFSIYSDTVIVPLTLFECATTSHKIILLRSKQKQNSVGTFLFQHQSFVPVTQVLAKHRSAESMWYDHSRYPPPQVWAQLEVPFYRFHEKILLLVGANGLV